MYFILYLNLLDFLEYTKFKHGKKGSDEKMEWTKLDRENNLIQREDKSNG